MSSRGPDIEIFSCENQSVETKIKTMDRGVRTFAVTDDSRFICIVDDSASVLIYSLSSSDTAMGKSFLGSDLETLVKDITSVSLVRDCFKIGFKVSWLPHNSITAVAVPSTTGMTTIFSRKCGRGASVDSIPVWEEIFLTTSSAAALTHGTVNINIATFSPNGRYLATADSVGIVLIWEVLLQSGDTFLTSEAFTVISMINSSPKGPLFDLVWGLKEADNYLMLVSPSASGIVQNVIDTSSGHQLPSGAIKASSNLKNIKEMGMPNSMAPVTATKTYLPYRHAEDAAVVSASKIAYENFSSSRVPAPASNISSASSTTLNSDVAISAATTLFSSTGIAAKFSRLQKSNSSIVDDDDDLQYDESEADMTKLRKSILDDSEKEENIPDVDLDDDDDTVVEEPNDIIANINRLAAGDASSSSSTNNILFKLQTSIATLLTANATAEKTAIAGPQKAFQPSSTTFDEKRKRYMVWNSIGNITCMDLDVKNRIEIRFTNTQRNRADAFNDNMNFTKAALSYEGAFFSSEPEEDADEDNVTKLKGSSIYYHAFPGQTILKGANEVIYLIVSNHTISPLITI